MTDFLFDTCALIWTADRAYMAPAAVAALDRSFRAGDFVSVSPISAWEIGILASRGRFRSAADPHDWFRRAIATDGMKLIDLTADVLIAASGLPGLPPRDPADRIVIATARKHDFIVVTRDRLILRYADEGYVKALPC